MQDLQNKVVELGNKLTAKDAELKNAAERGGTTAEQVTQLTTEKADIERQLRASRLERRADFLSFVTSARDQHSPPSTRQRSVSSPEELATVAENVRGAMDLLRARYADPLESPIADFGKKLRDYCDSEDFLAYDVVNVPVGDSNTVHVGQGYYWISKKALALFKPSGDLLRSDQKVSDLFHNAGKQSVNAGGLELKRVDYDPLKSFCNELPLSGVSDLSIRAAVRWILGLESLVNGKGASKRQGSGKSGPEVAPTIGELRLPREILSPILEKLLGRVQQAVEKSAEKGDPAVKTCLTKLNSAISACKSNNQPAPGLWTAVAARLNEAVKSSKPDVVVAFYCVLGIDGGNVECFVSAHRPSAARPEQGDLFAVLPGGAGFDPRRIGSLERGRWIPDPELCIGLPDGCPVICVSTSPGAKDPAAADPSK
jgi:hypothetical protein